MITVSVAIQTSLTDRPSASALLSATRWTQELLLGPLATAVAVLAIALVGFGMLSGRIDIRRGLTVVLGCFLLFGARDIAEGLRNAAANDSTVRTEVIPPPPAFPNPAHATADNASAFDPYAGAAVMHRKD